MVSSRSFFYAFKRKSALGAISCFPTFQEDWLHPCCGSRHLSAKSIQVRSAAREEDGTLQKEDKCLPGDEPLKSLPAIPVFDEG
jgi:hypothetical protein